MMFHEAAILIVDDSSIARRKIRQVLTEAGYGCIHEARDGESALAALQEIAPDLVILDILMPGIDGLEVCKRLREDPRAADAAVLFVTGSIEMDDRWRCFEAGGVDYIPKPFCPSELVARVNVQLELLWKRREMETLAAERAQQLMHAERLSTLGVLTAGVVHEIRNALGVIAQNTQLMEKSWPDLAALAEHAFANGLEHNGKRDLALEIYEEGTRDIGDGVKRMNEILNHILRFSRQKETNLQPTDLAAVMRQALVITHNRLRYHVTVHNEMPPDLPPVRSAPGPLAQVFVNLLVNAADATKEISDAQLTIHAGKSDLGIWCVVEDNGCGMTPEQLERIWDAFYTTKDVSEGTGLGLNISRQILEEAGGSIEVTSAPDSGAAFRMNFQPWTDPPGSD